MGFNRLMFNDDKTDAMVISAKITRKDNTQKIDPVSMPLIVGEAAIIPSSKIRNMVVIFDSHLTMKHQIQFRRKLDLVKPYLKALHWLPIEKRVEFKIDVLTYRYLNYHAPKYLHYVLFRPYATVCLRFFSRSVLSVPRTH